MYKQKYIILKYVRERLSDYIVNQVVHIESKHGIVIKVNKKYIEEIRNILEKMLEDQILYAYYEIHYYASDIVHYKLVYTLQ